MKLLSYAVMGVGLCLVLNACDKGSLSQPRPSADAATDVGAKRDAAMPDSDAGSADMRVADEPKSPDLRLADEPGADLRLGGDANAKDGPDASVGSPSADSADAQEADLPPAGCAGSFSGGVLSSDLTFTKACSPYVIQTTMDIREQATLVIEAGTVVLFARTTSVFVSGRLDIRGTSTDPVVLDAYSARPGPGVWSALRFGGTPAAPSQIRYATIRNCGWSASEGCVWTSTSTAKLLNVDHVTISDSAGYGFVAAGYGTTVPAGGFSMTNCTFRNIAKDAFAVRVHAKEFTGIGSGNDFGGSPIAVTGGSIWIDTAWTSPGTDIVVTWSNIELPGTGSGAPVTFSLGAGVRLLFDGSTGINIGGYNRLEARGTAEAPVVFSSAAPSPKPGDWSGIDVSVSRGGHGGINLSHAVIEYAGGNSGRSGGIILYETFYDATITDSVIRNNAGHGIYLSCPATTLPVLTGTKFEANASDLNQTGTIADNVGPGPSGTQACPAM